jgi:hypothetical protein
MNAAELAQRLEAKRTANGWEARCPAHEDKRASLSIAPAQDGSVLLHCHAGCATQAVVSAIGIEMSDLFPPRSNSSKPQMIASYPYTDENGTLLFEVCRFDPKDFRQRAPDGKCGWIWSTKGVRRVPFHLAKVLEAVKDGRPIFLAEGEKDVLAIEAAGFAATCNPGGAGKWLEEFSPHFKGAEVVIIADKDEPGRKHAANVAEKLKGAAASIKVIELPDLNGKTVKDAADFFAAGGEAIDLDTQASQAPEWETVDPVITLLRSTECDLSRTPPPLQTVFALAGTTVSTPANLTSITAAIKSGKSAVIGAMVASTAVRPGAEVDTLGFTSSNPEGLAVLLFDSEQSPDDFWHCEHRAVMRAGLERKPDWLHGFCLTGLGSKRAWEVVLKGMEVFSERHNGIHSVFLDGAADFVFDVNDPAESNAFVAELHDHAIRHACPIVTVIHFNPGSEKSRGHLGSQLERKAESNLALEKDKDGTTVIHSTKNRRAGIAKDFGPRFAWSDEKGMHVSVESRRSAVDAEKRESLFALAQDAFDQRPSMRFSELQTTVKKLLTVSERTAERKVSEMLRLTVIKKSVAGLYVITSKTGL